MEEEGVSILNITSSAEGDIAMMAQGKAEKLIKLLGIEVYLLFRDGGYPNTDFRDFIDAVEAVAISAFDKDKRKLEGELQSE